MTDREQFEAHWVRDVPSIYRKSALAEMKANRSEEFGYERAEIRWAWDAWQASRRAALEQAAKVCDERALNFRDNLRSLTCEACANAIRALAATDK